MSQLAANVHPLLTIDDAARLLNVKISRLRAAVFRNELPYIKIGRLVRFDFQDLKAWIEGQKDKN